MVFRITVGALIDQVAERGQELIESGRNSGKDLEMQAGRELSLAAEKIRNVYSDVLTESLDKVDAPIRNKLNQFDSLSSAALSRSESILKIFTSKIQQITNTLPFAQKQPQVSSITPTCIIPLITDYEVHIKIEGNFPCSAQNGCEPKLQIGDKQFTHIQNTTQLLEFSVPCSILFPPEQTSLSSFSIAKGILFLPWEQTSVLLGSQIIRDIYQIFISAIPASPGAILLQYEVEIKEEEQKEFKAGGFHLEAFPRDRINVPFTVSAEDGWHVKRNTHSINVRGARGNCSHHFGGDDGDRVTYYVSVKGKTFPLFGQPSRTNFSIHFKEFRYITKEVFFTDNIELRWGDSKVIDKTMKSWKIVFHAFDGTTQEYLGPGPDIIDRFIKISSLNGKLHLSTQDPANLMVVNSSAISRPRL